ncbi:hypothetical protein GGX14DRAFT_436818, partial [Mycena pura]
MMFSYEISPIPLPASDSDVFKYSHLRLLALKTNPEAYGTTFTGESRNTPAMWRERIDNPERLTIIARAKAQRAVSDISSGKPADCASPEGQEECEWVGTASILTPEMLRADSGDAARNEYVLVGMWVHPAHRRTGLGKRLIETGIAWVRARTEGMPDGERRVI